MAIVVSGKTFQMGSIGFIIALCVLGGCFILWMLGKGNPAELGLIAALAVAYLIG